MENERYQVDGPTQRPGSRFFFLEDVFVRGYEGLILRYLGCRRALKGLLTYYKSSIHPTEV